MLGFVLFGTAQDADADPIGIVERYALSENRAQLLEELVPGSQEYYFYHRSAGVDGGEFPAACCCL
ncbi:MAG: hypothetical protein AAFN70_16475, partial [Planctomycetota bacterium]